MAPRSPLQPVTPDRARVVVYEAKLRHGEDWERHVERYLTPLERVYLLTRARDEGRDWLDVLEDARTARRENPVGTLAGIAALFAMFPITPVVAGAAALHNHVKNGRKKNPASRKRYFFHASPPAARASILRHGLRPGATASRGPPAVYLFAERAFAEDYRSGVAYDVWRVDTQGVPTYSDPEDPVGAAYTETPLPPARLRWLGTYEGGELVERPRGQNPLDEDALDDYSEGDEEWSPYKLHDALNAAEKRFGVHLAGPVYGCGSYGCAAPLVDGRVLKATVDTDEVAWATLTRVHQVPGMVRIDTVPEVVGVDDWDQGEGPEPGEEAGPVLNIWAYVREAAADLPYDPYRMWSGVGERARKAGELLGDVQKGASVFMQLGYSLTDATKKNLGLDAQGRVVVRDGRVAPRGTLRTKMS